jgi:hypothetical protein
VFNLENNFQKKVQFRKFGTGSIEMGVQNLVFIFFPHAREGVIKENGKGKNVYFIKNMEIVDSIILTSEYLHY